MLINPEIPDPEDLTSTCFTSTCYSPAMTLLISLNPFNFYLLSPNLALMISLNTLLTSTFTVRTMI
ncbi:hypothetical protein EO98_11950 [Methanosarcina sp. 2.H.T.1A.6]|uniref:hypothetical protein n=1 Tax=unclassified Methanosarcina TaxID=2644672 RepID=UPI0006229C47|nr:MULTISPECIES: hypothetical protein [unclassified Methanosarcina]KKG16288.1 hypothetical protein EO94_09475 [Methanosarcina sp. 2.H.T.1A.3]KKG22361.1 hypothetical protein EO97_14995 [Methanosarcina sp. 2.H.T.1A.15]KKG22992.1 hypothetical protein EO98_11950 [Methanosarcina sp. 2.H.T.1A.6]KKG26215.1 hypothetical protein EO96_04435 [Methanosarcina sp. 2.H.T.1A.8]